MTGIVANLLHILNAPSGADLTASLDSEAVACLRDGRVRQLAETADELCRLDLDRRPRAELARVWVSDVTGCCSRPNPDTPTTPTRRLTDAFKTLDRNSDVTGSGAAAWVLARHSITIGDHDGAAHWLDLATQRLPGGICLDHDTLVFLATHQFWRDGDVTTSLRSARLALALALGHDERHAAADVLVHLGFLRYVSGDNDAAELAFGRAGDLYGELEPRSGRTLRPLLDTYRGVVLAREGHRVDAVSAFATAATLSVELHTPWLGAINDARFAMSMPDHPDAAAAARRAIDVPMCVDQGWTPSMGWRALALIEHVAGRLDRAGEHYRRALLEPVNDLEAAYIEGALIAVDLASDTPAHTRHRLDATVATYDRLGATYPAVATLLAYSSILPDHAPELLAEAHRRSGSSSVCDHLWLDRPELTIHLAGCGHLALDGQRLALSGKPLELVLALVTDDAPTMHWEVAAAALWPDDHDLAKLRSRLTTTTATARRQLGTERWRLERDGQFLRFIMRRAVIVDDGDNLLASTHGPTG